MKQFKIGRSHYILEDEKTQLDVFIQNNQILGVYDMINKRAYTKDELKSLKWGVLDEKRVNNR
jgi:hypothetical protein